MGQVAKHSESITDEMWELVNPFNREMVQEFLDNKTELSKDTKYVYESSLRIFFYWVYEKLDNKKCIDIKKKEFVKFLNWLTNRGLSESAIKLKKSSVSSFCNYIMLMYEEEYPTFRTFVTSEMKVVKTGYVHEKEPLTVDEYNMLCNELREREEWQKLAYLMFSYSTGCRRSEAWQLLKEVIDYKPIEKEITVKDEDGNDVKAISRSYQTHLIRCKGASQVGKPRRLKFDEECMEVIKKWIEVRGEDDCPYVFVTKKSDGTTEQICKTTFNGWCKNCFSKIVGRRVHPHLTRESRATNLVLSGKSPEVAQKLLGHVDVSTTKKHYIILPDEEDESDEAFI